MCVGGIVVENQFGSDTRFLAKSKSRTFRRAAKGAPFLWGLVYFLESAAKQGTYSVYSVFSVYRVLVCEIAHADYSFW